MFYWMGCMWCMCVCVSSLKRQKWRYNLVIGIGIVDVALACVNVCVVLDVDVVAYVQCCQSFRWVIAVCFESKPDRTRRRAIIDMRGWIILWIHNYVVCFFFFFFKWSNRMEKWNKNQIQISQQILCVRKSKYMLRLKALFITKQTKNMFRFFFCCSFRKI